MMGVGVDIGKHVDHCAIMGVNLRPRVYDPNLPDPPAMDAGYLKRPRKIIHEYQVTLMERPPLGTKYQLVEDRVVDIMKMPAFLDESRLLVDLGEVGDVVYENWRDRHFLNPIGIRIVGGNSVNRSEEGFNVGKARLLSPLMNVFSTRRIRFAKANPYAEGLTDRQRLIRREYDRLKRVIMKELQDITLEFTKKGNMTLEARGSDHDDMVLALAMVVWYFEHIYRQLFDEGEYDNPAEPRRRARDDSWNPLWDGEDF